MQKLANHKAHRFHQVQVQIPQVLQVISQKAEFIKTARKKELVLHLIVLRTENIKNTKSIKKVKSMILIVKVYLQQPSKNKSI